MFPVDTGIDNSFYWIMYQEVVTIAVNEGCFTMLEVINVEDEGKQELPKLVKRKRLMVLF